MEYRTLHDMFVLGLPLAEKILRPIVVYLFLVVGFRVAGKRELAQLNPFDLVVLLTISNTVQNAIIGDDNSVAGGFIGAFTLVFCKYVVIRFLFRQRRLDQILEGRPTMLVREGKVNKKELARELITMSELQSVARRQGFDGIHEIQECVLQPGGVFLMKRKCPSNEETKHQELVTRLEALSQQLAILESRLPQAL